MALPPTSRYKQGIKLAGVLYFHRISDVRMGGAPLKNFKMFRKLCGERALQNVVIVTNMWEEVKGQVGERREAELKGKDIFFKSVLENGARMARHKNTTSSAQDILRLILDNRPLPLCIQVELVDEHRCITETSAGEELNQELNTRIRKHREDIRALEEEMQQAMRDKDEEIRRRLEEETQKMRYEARMIEVEAERMASDYQRRKQELKALETQLAEQEAASHGNWFPRFTLEPDFFSVVITTWATLIASAILPTPEVVMSTLLAAILSTARTRSQ